MTRQLGSGRAAWVTALVGSLLVMGGCAELFGTGASGDRSAALRKFQSEGELLAFIREQRSSSATRTGAGWGLFAMDVIAAAPEGTGANGAGAGYSGTNIQEAGVDESDRVLTDGSYLYVMCDGSVRIVRATAGAELAEAGSIPIDSANNEAYLVGRTLIVLGTPAESEVVPMDGSPRAELMIWPPYYPRSKVIVTSIDVTTPAAPRVLGRMELEGALATSRVIDDRLHLVLTYVPPSSAEGSAAQSAAGTAGGVLPKASAGGAYGPAVQWSDVYRPGDPAGYYMTAIVTLDTANIEKIVGSVAVVENAATIYASRQALYLGSARWNETSGQATTVIHKFSFNGDGAARYVGTGEVPGTLLNQFSLGEHEGHLRLATHVPPALARSTGVFDLLGLGVVSSDATTSVDVAEPSNAVYVLAGADARLDIIGRVEGLAPGERLYSARFLGPRGFLVTFRQVDPLFALDLSNPAAPRVVGELKIPGYSDYLHPLGENLLLGVGRSVATNSWGGVTPSAVQVSLFDVSNLADPKVIVQKEFGGYGSWCEVSETHKAFAIHPDGRTVAMPMTLTATGAGSSPTVPSAPQFDGIVVLDVSAAGGIQTLGSLATVRAEGATPWDWTWRRTRFIGSAVYGVSEAGVRAATTSNLAEQSVLTLSQE